MGRRVLLAAAGLGAFAVLAMAVLLFALPLPGRAPYLARPSILIEDRYGRALYEAIDPEGSKNVPLPLSQIPLACRKAVLSTEDSNFYRHRGVDLLALGRAVWQNLSSGRTVSGASTLTQQLARNLYMPPEERLQRTPVRKLREAWLALQLERRYDKDELLALYLNTTYFGHFAAGIEGAARAYFGQGAEGLDLAQCALLAGLPQSPAAYNPIQHPEAARRRQRVVLDLMVRDGVVSEDDARTAAAEQLSFSATPFPISAPHFVNWAQEQAEQLLGAERAGAGGLRVRTTLDLDWQEGAERAVRRQLAALQPCLGEPATICDPDAEPGRRVEGAALVAVDPHDGAVRAMVGSPNYFDDLHAGALNAALAPRQPGSAIKPLTYAAAFGLPDRPWTPSTLIPDVRTAFTTDEGRPYVPQNYDLRYHGPVTAAGGARQLVQRAGGAGARLRGHRRAGATGRAAWDRHLRGAPGHPAGGLGALLAVRARADARGRRSPAAGPDGCVRGVRQRRLSGRAVRHRADRDAGRRCAVRAAGS